MKIAIIGKGYVGQAVGKFLAKQHAIVFKDVDDSWDIVVGCDLAVVCVPTEQKENGKADISIVEKAVAECPISDMVIKSTCPPGTTKFLQAEYFETNLAFCPEFIGEGNYPAAWWLGEPHQTDMAKHPVCIIGGSNPAADKWYQAVKFLYGTQCKFHYMLTAEAEMVKYMVNTWLATKITYCNEMAKVCESMGLSYERVREAWLGDGRVGRSHTTVDNGYGGKCLPKDLAGIIHAAQQFGYEPELLKEVRNSNHRFGGDS